MTHDNDTYGTHDTPGTHHAKGTCILCGDRLRITDIHTARPLVDGRCCRICYGTLIVPARTLLRVVRRGASRDMLREDLCRSALKAAEKGRMAREAKW